MGTLNVVECPRQNGRQNRGEGTSILTESRQNGRQNMGEEQAFWRSTVRTASCAIEHNFYNRCEETKPPVLKTGAPYDNERPETHTCKTNDNGP